jgi:hypothetical protein
MGNLEHIWDQHNMPRLLTVQPKVQSWFLYVTVLRIPSKITSKGAGQSGFG